MENERPPTLADLLRRRIATAYESQADFARSLGIKPQKLSSWLRKGGVVPEASSRRMLAKELGVRHVDILVAAGELWPSEIEPAADCPPSEAEQILASFDQEQREAVMVMLRRFQATTEQKRIATDQPAPAEAAGC